MNKEDRLGNELNPGDVILYPKHSSLHIAKIIKFTEKAILVSCLRKRYDYDPNQDHLKSWRKTGTWVLDPKGQVWDCNDLEKHNGSKRLSNYYLYHIIKIS